jgi:hypothetical protein
MLTHPAGNISHTLSPSRARALMTLSLIMNKYCDYNNVTGIKLAKSPQEKAVLRLAGQETWRLGAAVCVSYIRRYANKAARTQARTCGIAAREQGPSVNFLSESQRYFKPAVC